MKTAYLIVAVVLFAVSRLPFANWYSFENARTISWFISSASSFFLGMSVATP